MPVSKITHLGKEIVVVDCSNCGMEAKDQIIATLQEGSRMIASYGSGKANVITVVKNVSFNNDLTESFKEYASRNTPYVSKSALVGLEGLQKIIFSAIKALTKRDYYLAATMDEAKAFMAE